ncbi:MFS transporter [Rhodococcus sp. D2-41]|uniref:MFS transporter n=1 Tax=Speluncibacter jeojiensis TaxID=2710754 RepID=A0A9X4RFK2_9ACTN|nr:MFS transporter [Rhodococcus sp. D2-41]MDG3009444.1 MFS transporter [Rhodococcus sp. D2-41]MDG3016372.1 MFS transporter [Corynebacteriales bacterium D3-21]
MAIQTTAPAQPEAGPANPNHARRWLVLCIVALAQLTVVLDGTIVTIALPQAQEDLGISDVDRQWAITAYALAFGALLLLGGRIADYWGRKRSFMVGMAGFAVASGIGGLAQNGIELFAARAGQGVFAALLAPAALAIVTTTFVEEKERAKAFAVFGAISGGGAAIGLLLGGILTEYLTWRWCLLVNVPVAVLAIAAAAAVMRESRAHGDTSYDLPGAVLITLGLGSLVYGFAQAEHGWTTASTLGFIIAGLVLLAVFVAVEARSANPILPLAIPLHRDRGAAYIGSALVGAALLGGMLYLTIYTQLVLGFSPVVSGLSFLPMTVAIVIAAGVSSQLGTRIGPKPLMAAGPVIAAAGLLWTTQLDIHSSYVTGVLPGLLLFGFGLGLLMVQMQNVALVGVADHDAGAASALANATVQIGGALGTALFTTIYVAAKDAFRAANPMPTPPAGFPTGMIPTDLATAKPPSAAQLSMLPESFRDFLDQLKDYFFSTEVSGYVHTFAWAAVLVALICPVVLVLVRAKRSDVPAEGPVHLG